MTVKRPPRAIARAWKLADELLGVWPQTRDALHPDDGIAEDTRVIELEEAIHFVHQCLREEMSARALPTGDGERVLIADLIGIAPNLTDGLPSEVWIRKMRGEDCD